MDREQVLAALSAVNDVLARKDQHESVTVIGGGALMFLFDDFYRGVKDLDGTGISPNLEAAIEEVAWAHDLPADWFNNDADLYYAPKEVVPGPQFSNLSVQTPSKLYMLCLKIMSGRAEEKAHDSKDVQFMLERMPEIKTDQDWQGPYRQWFGKTDWSGFCAETAHQVLSKTSAHDTSDETGRFWGDEGAGVVFWCPDTRNVLLAKRSQHVNEPGTWGTWGGALEDGESPSEAAKREAYEEAGAEVEEVELVWTFQDPHSDFQYHNFVAVVSHEFKPKMDWEIAGYKWVPLTAPPSPPHFGLKALWPHLKQWTSQAKISRRKRADVGDNGSATQNPPEPLLVALINQSEWKKRQLDDGRVHVFTEPDNVELQQNPSPFRQKQAKPIEVPPELLNKLAALVQQRVLTGLRLGETHTTLPIDDDVSRWLPLAKVRQVIVEWPKASHGQSSVDAVYLQGTDIHLKLTGVHFDLVLQNDVRGALGHELAHAVQIGHQGEAQFLKNPERENLGSHTNNQEIKAVSAEMCAEYKRGLSKDPVLSVEEFLRDNWQWREVQKRSTEEGRKRLLLDLASVWTAAQDGRLLIPTHPKTRTSSTQSVSELEVRSGLEEETSRRRGDSLRAGSTTGGGSSGQIVAGSVVEGGNSSLPPSMVSGLESEEDRKTIMDSYGQSWPTVGDTRIGRRGNGSLKGPNARRRRVSELAQVRSGLESKTGHREGVSPFRQKQANENKIEQARQFAAGKHESQKRKYTGEPYIIHPEAVAETVRQVGGNTDMICAALLHDVIEDQGVTPQEITDLFGPHVSKLVVEMTEVSKLEDGNRRTRKELDRQHYSTISPEGQTIKLADILDNGSDIIQTNPAFARTYIPECEALFHVLTQGNATLRGRVAQMLGSAKVKLNDRSKP